MQPENIRSYQEDLEERIRQKEKELQEIKRKVDLKEKINERKREDLSNRKQLHDEDIALQHVHYVEQRPLPNNSQRAARQGKPEGERERKAEGNSQRHLKPQVEELPSIPIRPAQPNKVPNVDPQRPQAQPLPTLSNDSLSQRPQ